VVAAAVVRDVPVPFAPGKGERRAVSPFPGERCSQSVPCCSAVFRSPVTRLCIVRIQIFCRTQKDGTQQERRKKQTRAAGDSHALPLCLSPWSMCLSVSLRGRCDSIRHSIRLLCHIDSIVIKSPLPPSCLSIALRVTFQTEFETVKGRECHLSSKEHKIGKATTKIGVHTAEVDKLGETLGAAAKRWDGLVALPLGAPVSLKSISFPLTRRIT